MLSPEVKSLPKFDCSDFSNNPESVELLPRPEVSSTPARFDLSAPPKFRSSSIFYYPPSIDLAAPPLKPVAPPILDIPPPILDGDGKSYIYLLDISGCSF